MKWYKPLVIRRIHGHSMVPVLPPGTLIVVSGVGRKPMAGDIIVFEHEGKEKIKRVDHVLGDGSLYVVGEHPETSKDSRQFGAIDPSVVIGRMILPHPHPQ